MADETKPRTTSHAKSVDGLARQETALDRALTLREHFNRAQAQQQAQQMEQTKSGEQQQGSGMVKRHAPQPRLTPKGPMRNLADRQVRGTAFQREHTAEAQKLENARKAAELLRTRQQNDRDRDQER